MKHLIFFVLFSTFLNAQNTMQYKELCAKAENSSTAAKQMVKLAETDYEKTNKPIYLAFSGLGNLFMAKHSFNPFNKMSYFNDGKKMIDKAISLEPSNLEMRFLRLISQNKLPKILGYYGNVTEDKNYLIKNYKSSQDTILKKEIQNYLNL